MKDKTFTNKASQITSLKGKWATLNSKELEIQWKAIPWKTIEERVNKLQSRITKAITEGKVGLIKKLQHLLTNSFFAKLLAVRKVTTNKGKNTPGIDKRIWSTPGSKFKGALALKLKGYSSNPLRRTYIEKKGKKKKRPLGIPTMHDRAMQALHAMALDPIAEATADKVSFGFRKKRSIKDAAAHIFRHLRLRNSAQWILEGDIKGCFDNINHQWMLNNIPMDKRILTQFLKAGFIHQKKLFPTEQGTPQGGIISPILANMTLDGIERKIKRKYWTNKKGTMDRDYNKHKVNYTRYADDFIVTAESKEILHDIKQMIIDHLKERGLMLSEEKTLITHIDRGFDFLGWNFRKFKGILIIRPSKASLKNISDKISNTIKSYRTAKQENLIRKLNPIITGWCNNHRNVAAKEAFSKLENTVFRSLWKWARRRHSNKPKQWIKDRYWKKMNNRDWIFCDKKITLKSATSTKIIRHLLIKFDANPYLPTDKLYYIAREKQRKKWKSKHAANTIKIVG
ncbi:MAG: group II intron reverse transcriptase/maturase [Planctomycetes bacterium]|nr:group II intron reverse transcriptase/maturase [Planctomycetota bacterium]